jgi:hypothetical protein
VIFFDPEALRPVCDRPHDFLSWWADPRDARP